MNSIAFPNMLSSTKINIVKDDEATKNNTRLLLLSRQNTLLGDPAYGTRLDRSIFSYVAIIKDLVVDNIYSSLRIYMPQLSLSRNDIKIFSYKTKLRASFRALNILSKNTDLFNIKLTDDYSIE